MTTPGLAIDEQNPWPGLAAFDEAAERFFNGRRQETAELRRLVLQSPLTVLFGASGLGKTSLLQAGLFPMLRTDGVLPVYVRLDVRDTGAPLIDQVTRALDNEIRLQRVDCPPIDHRESLWHNLHREGLELWSAQNRLLTPLFVLDQFEEVFTLGAENRDAVARLRRDLADLIENRLPPDLTAPGDGTSSLELALDRQPYKVLLSFREDFLPALEGWKRELPSVARNRFRLLPMSGEQAFEAVHTTAPHLADAAIAREIVRFVAVAQEAEPGVGGGDGMSDLAVEPALLSLVCRGLNERRKAQGKPAFDQALLRHGGQSIISDYYEESVRDLPERVQRFIEKELITERGYRKPCDVDDARTAYGVTEQELRALVDRRLLRIEPHQGTNRVELTHDLLTRVVREHREGQRLRERTRRQRRRLAIVTGSGVVLGALVVVFFLLYRNADRQRRVAEMQTRVATAQRLASQSRDALARFPQRGILLAVEAVNHSLRAHEPVVADAEQALREALATAGGIGFGGAGAPISSVTTSPNGRWLAIIRERAIYVADLSIAPPLALTRLGGLSSDAKPNEYYPPHVMFGGDGQTLVATALGSGPQVWQLSATPAASLSVASPAGVGPVLASTISGDGRWLIGLTRDMTLVFWDLSSAAGVSTPVVVKSDTSLNFVDPGGRPLTGVIDAGNKEVLQDAITGALGVAKIQAADPAQHRIVLEYLRGAAVSPDGRWMISTDLDAKALRLVDLKAADPSAGSRPLSDDVGTLPTQVFSANSRRLAVVGESGITRVWDLAVPDPRASQVELPTRSRDVTGIPAIAISPEGKWLLTAARVNRLDPNRRPATSAWLWNLELPNPSEHPFELTGHEAGVGAVTITPDGRWAITGSDGGVVRLWNLANEDPSAAPLVLRGHERGIDAIAVTADTRWLITSGEDGSVRAFDLRAPQPAAMPLQIGASTATGSATVSPDGRWLARGGMGDGGHLWDLSLPNPAIAPVVLPKVSAVPHTSSFWFTPDMRWIVTAGEYEVARLFDLKGARIADSGRILDTGDGRIRKLAISPDSRWLAMTREYHGEQTRLWDLLHPKPDWTPFVLKGALLDIGGDNRSMVTSPVGGGLLLWNLTSGDPNSSAPVELKGHVKSISAWHYTTDGRLLITVSDDRVQVWDVASNPPSARVLEGPGSRTDHLYVSPDGRWLVTAGETLRLVDLQSRQPATASRLLSKEPTSYPGPLVRFTPDSRWLMTTSGQTARLWNLRAPDPAANPFVLRGHEHGAGAVAVSPDSRWLCTSGASDISGPKDTVLRLWNLTSADPSASPLLLLGHERGTPLMVMAPDSRWLITGSEDATLRFWDLRSDNPAATPLVVPAYSNVGSLDITADGRFVVSGGGDGLVRLWRLRLEDLVSLAQSVSGRNLSLEEWQLFFQGQKYRRTFDALPEPARPQQKVPK